MAKLASYQIELRGPASSDLRRFALDLLKLRKQFLVDGRDSAAREAEEALGERGIFIVEESSERVVWSRGNAVPRTRRRFVSPSFIRV